MRTWSGRVVWILGAVVLGLPTLGAVTVLAQKNSDTKSVATILRKMPVPVRDVDKAAQKPFAYWAEIHFDEANQGMYQETEAVTVPLGKILVLEYANVVSCVQPDESLSINLIATYDSGGQRGEQDLKLMVADQGVFREPTGVYRHLGGSQTMKIYIEGGQSFRFSAWRSSEKGGHAEASAWVSGYLAPAR